MVSKRSILPGPGERALITGQTGSGKTAFVTWMLMRTEQSPVIIYDTKEERKFEALPNVRIVTTQEDLTDAYNDQSLDYIVMRPDIDTVVNPRALDELLFHHWLVYKNSVAYVDELYMFHVAGRAGRGLTALYTRGRSSGITTICATQRPAWISGFAISEAQKFFAFFLNMKDDKKKLNPELLELPDPPKFGFYYWEAGQEKQLTKYGAVKLDKGLDTGYVDNQSKPLTTETDENTAEPVAVASKRRGAIFI